MKRENLGWNRSDHGLARERNQQVARVGVVGAGSLSSRGCRVFSLQLGNPLPQLDYLFIRHVRVRVEG